VHDLEVIPENVYAEIRKGIIEKDNETLWEKGYLGISPNESSGSQ
jgi:hypothetical protein